MAENCGIASVKKKQIYTTEEAVEFLQVSGSYDNISSEFTESDRIRNKSKYECKECRVGLCAAPCFGYYLKKGLF